MANRQPRGPSGAALTQLVAGPAYAVPLHLPDLPDRAQAKGHADEQHDPGNDTVPILEHGVLASLLLIDPGDALHKS